MRPTEGYVPPNINSDGALLGGRIRYRNLIEAVILVSIDILLFYKVLSFLPLYVRLVGGILIGLTLGALGAFGINEEPLSGFILSFFIFNKTKCFVKLRMPMPHIMTEKEKKELEKEKAREKNKGKQKKINELKGKLPRLGFKNPFYIILQKFRKTEEDMDHEER